MILHFLEQYPLIVLSIIGGVITGSFKVWQEIDAQREVKKAAAEFDKTRWNKRPVMDYDGQEPERV